MNFIWTSWISIRVSLTISCFNLGSYVSWFISVLSAPHEMFAVVSMADAILALSNCKTGSNMSHCSLRLVICSSCYQIFGAIIATKILDLVDSASHTRTSASGMVMIDGPCCSCSVETVVSAVFSAHCLNSHNFWWPTGRATQVNLSCHEFLALFQLYIVQADFVLITVMTRLGLSCLKMFTPLEDNWCQVECFCVLTSSKKCVKREMIDFVWNIVMWLCST